MSSVWDDIVEPEGESIYNDNTNEEYYSSVDPNYVPDVEYFDPYTTEAPESVTEAQNEFDQVNVATQDYADEWTARIIADRNGYMTDDNYQGALNKTLTNQSYDYLKRANNGADDPTAWGKSNPEDDFFTRWLPDMLKKADLDRQTQEQMNKQTPTEEERMVQSAYGGLTTQAQRDIMDARDMEYGNWNLMSWWDKAKYLLVPGSNATKMDNTPEWAKYIQNIFPSVMASGAGAMVGSLAGPAGTAIGALTVGGLTYLQGVTDIKIPILNEVLEGLDILSVWFEQGQGALGAAVSEAWKQQKDQPFDLLELAKTTGEILSDPNNKYLWDAAKYSYEASADLGFDDTLNFIRNVGAKASDTFFGTDFGQRKISDVSRANIGHSGLEEAIEGTQGYDSILNTYMPVFTGLVEAAMQNGMSEEQAKQFAHQNMEEYLINYMGSTGLTRDLVASSVADPMNLIPFVTAKTTEGIGKVTNNPALQRAGQAAAGNVLIDMLPPGVQGLAETITGKHGSQGIDTIAQVYKEGLRNTVDVDNLSGWQKRFAGIDNDGKIKEWAPNKKTGNAVADYLRNLFKTTDETKMFDISQTTTEFLGSILFDETTGPWNIGDLVEQVTGKQSIPDDSPLARFRNTAMLKTLQDSFAGVDAGTIEGIKNDVMNYRKFAENRAIVDSVAEKLNMTPDEIFDALDNKGIDRNSKQYQNMNKKQKKAALDAERRGLYQKIRDAGITFTDANGNVLDANKIIKKIDVFRTIDTDGTRLDYTAGKRQYSMTYLKASIMESIANIADNYNLKRYGISPDTWAVRMSNLAKSMQSIALLNFSTSYQVNNWLNNMITRSVEGIGGVNSKNLTAANEKRGLSFSRDSKEFGDTKERIAKQKKASDRLQKFDDMYNDFSRSSILKGVNNLDVEGSETRAAFNIGANRYWEATWGASIPEMPPEWKNIGITSDMQQQIFKIALDSSSLTEFKKKMMGEVVLPGAASTLAQMIANNCDQRTGQVIRDYFATKPWISEMVDSFLETGDERIISKGFDHLIQDITNDIGLENVNQLNSTFEDLRNRYSNEGLGAVAVAFDALNDLYADVWIKQTKENGSTFIDRITKGLSQEEFDKRYATLTKMQTNDYHIARGYLLMNIAALVDGIGLNHDAGVEMVSHAMSFYDTAEQYIKVRHELHDRYGVKTSKEYDFKRYKRESIEACTKMLDAQLEGTKAVHKTLVDHLRNNLDPSLTGHIDLFEKALNDLITLKEADNKAEIRDLTIRIDAENKRSRAQISLGQERPRVRDKQKIHDAYERAAYELKILDNAMQNNQQTTPTKKMSLEDTLRIEMMYEEAQQISKNSAAFLKKYQKGADPSKVYQPVNFENSKVKTSFLQYANQKIGDDGRAHGLTDAQIKAQVHQNILDYATGKAVTLGTMDATQPGVKFLDPQTKTWGTHPVLDHFQLLDPNADPKVSGSKFSMARSEPYSYNGQIVTAGVFHKGDVIAYITEGMPQTVTVEGKSYPVIGISPKNPDTMVLYVGDKVWEVTPGQPKNAQYTIYATQNFHPGQPGTTPTIQHWGQAGLESSVGIRQALNLWKEQAISDLHKAQSNGSFFGNLNDTQKAAVYQWMDNNLKQAYNAQRFQTQRYADTMIDATLLNYNKRYGFDNTLTMLCPYQFWMTRSVMNWGKRMISQPAWFSMYARLQKLIEKNKKDFLPTRLEGLVGIPMPNMGDGMGDSFYIDIFNTIFPFQQFYNATEYFEKNLNTIHQNTLTQIDDMYADGLPFNGQEITQEMYDEAMLGKGDLYWTLYKQNRDVDESDTSATGLLSTFLSPPVWFDALRKHIAGKDKDISYSPMFRLGNMVKATGDDTFLEDMTNLIGGTLQLPENALRRVAGIESNPDGNYADAGVLAMIADMETNMEISRNQAKNAMIEGPGNEIYDKALFRYRQSQAYRQQGGALATEIGQGLIGRNKKTSLGQLAGSAAVSLFGGKIYPQGEREHRVEQDLYRNIRKNDTEDKEIASNFWDAYPTYNIRNFAYEDNPEERYHEILLDNLKQAYYALPDIQKNQVYDALGPRFQKLFADKDTRAYDHLEPEEMIQWTRAMQGNVPNLNQDQIMQSLQESQQINWVANSVQGDYERYRRDKERLFPGIDTVYDGYMKTPKNMQDKYLAENPMLQKYWDWQDKVKRANPRLETLLDKSSASYKVYKGQYDNITDALMANLNESTMKQLQNHIQYGWKIAPWAERTLKRTYTNLHVNVPYETWLKSLSKNN